jgi:hypothetical protein
MPIYPSIEESFMRLHQSGWSIGETAGGAVWIASGSNGKIQIRAEGQSQADAWYRATLQAEASGMLRH